MTVERPGPTDADVLEHDWPLIDLRSFRKRYRPSRLRRAALLGGVAPQPPRTHIDAARMSDRAQRAARQTDEPEPRFTGRSREPDLDGARRQSAKRTRVVVEHLDQDVELVGVSLDEIERARITAAAVPLDLRSRDRHRSGAGGRGAG